jgi:hypothetical protein
LTIANPISALSINHGIVDNVQSEINKKYNLYFPVETTGGNIFALFQDPDDIRLKDPFPGAYPTKNIIERNIRQEKSGRWQLLLHQY